MSFLFPKSKSAPPPPPTPQVRDEGAAGESDEEKKRRIGRAALISERQNQLGNPTTGRRLLTP